MAGFDKNDGKIDFYALKPSDGIELRRFPRSYELLWTGQVPVVVNMFCLRTSS